MNKCFRVFTTAAIAAGALLSGTADAVSQNKSPFDQWLESRNSIRLSWQELNVVNANGVVMASRKPMTLMACTSDNHLVYGDIFAAALPQDVDYIMPDTPTIFLHSITESFNAAIRNISAQDLKQYLTPQPSLPPAVMQTMKDAAKIENEVMSQKGNRPLKWIMYSYGVTDKPEDYCIKKHNKTMVSSQQILAPGK